MDEFTPEDDVEQEVVEDEEDIEIEDVIGAEGDEQQKAEAADLAKLLRQHPEVWIPYEEQVQEQLNTKPPGPIPTEPSGLSLSLRELRNVDSTHRTYPFLTNYEKTKCISYRASQIGHGAKPYILVPDGVTDSYEIAKMELESKRLPFILRRPLPDGTFEVWRLTDLIVL